MHECKTLYVCSHACMYVCMSVHLYTNLHACVIVRTAYVLETHYTLAEYDA